MDTAIASTERMIDTLDVRVLGDQVESKLTPEELALLREALED
jgi:hypothetical protein